MTVPFPLVAAVHSGLRAALLLIATCSVMWAAAGDYFFTNPQSTNAVVGEAVDLSCTAGFGNGGDTCAWYRNSVLYTGGTITKTGNDFHLVFVATAGDDGAQFFARVTGLKKGLTVPESEDSTPATITIVSPSTPFTLTAPAPGTVVTGDTALNPIGIRFTASRPVTTWEVNYPATDAVFRTFGNGALYSTTQILVPPHLPTADTAVKIRITSPDAEVFTGDFTLGAQQLAPLSLSTATFSSPYYTAFAGVPFTVDQQHGLARFISDPNGDPVTYAKVSGANLTINANGSFSWTPPAFPAGTTFPSTNLQHQLTLAGTFTATDGLHAAVGPFDIYVSVLANPGDLNRDGVVNIQDVQLVLSKFGQNPGVPTDP